MAGDHQKILSNLYFVLFLKDQNTMRWKDLFSSSKFSNSEPLWIPLVQKMWVGNSQSLTDWWMINYPYSNVQFEIQDGQGESFWIIVGLSNLDPLKMIPSTTDLLIYTLGQCWTFMDFVFASIQLIPLFWNSSRRTLNASLNTFDKTFKSTLTVRRFRIQNDSKKKNAMLVIFSLLCVARFTHA